MPAYREALQFIQQALQELYDADEAAAIGREVLEFITGKTHSTQLANNGRIDVPEEAALQNIITQLQTGRPMQYVLGLAWFMNRKYLVNENVLIPRPETEELVQWIIDDQKNGLLAPSILDIGTGSGCIPISLKLAISSAAITSCDISNSAIGVARQNAASLKAEVTFTTKDFLDAAQQETFGQYDLIVSNPPYIPLQEKASLHRNVTDYEPATALFVPDNDPLLFYRAIALFAKRHLKAGGAVYCELHQDFGTATEGMFRDAGYTNVQLRKDINGHWRMLKASL